MPFLLEFTVQAISIHPPEAGRRAVRLCLAYQITRASPESIRLKADFFPNRIRRTAPYTRPKQQEGALPPPLRCPACARLP